jgi:fibronectin-binding autotransporter adhesin
LALAGVMWLCAASAQAQYVVTDPGDCTGCGSLRDAIIAANAGAVPATIDLTGIAGTISLATPLPTITVPLSMTGPGAPMGLNGGAQGAVVLEMTEDVTLSGVPIEDALTKSGTGTLILKDALAYLGDTAILAGAIRTDLDNILSPASSVSIAAGALLDLNNYSQEIAALSGEGDVSLADAVLVTTFAGGTVTFAGTIAGTINSGFVKLGAGTLVLSGTNQSNGFVDVEEGTLRLTGPEAVAASSIVVVNDGAILDLADTSQTVQTLTTGLATVALGSGTLTVVVPDPFTPAFVGGTITGTGNLVKNGPGDLLFFEPSTYSGNTTIDDGILELFGDNFLSGSSTLTVNGGALFLDGLQTFAALSGSGGTVDMCVCATLTINQSIDTLYGGAIAGSASVTKAGAGTLTLAGANTYTGTTTVSAGTLRITGSTSASSAVTVANGATLAGTGSVSGPIVVAGGGTITTGNSPGVLTTGAVTIPAGSSVPLKLNGTAPGTQYDRLNVLGTVTLGGTLTVSLGFTPTIGQSFVILDNDGVDAVDAAFAGLPQDGTLLVGGSAPFRISYTGDTGNDVTLTYLGVTPTLTVSLSPGVYVGGILSATATLAGAAGAVGTITFRAYGPNDSTCAQPPVFTSVRTVAGNAVYGSEDFGPSSAGVYRWIASFSGDGQYLPVASACGAASQTVTSKATQTIAFGAIAPTIYGSAPFAVSAVASSGLPVTFSSVTPLVCSVSGSTVSLIAAGTCTIAASQAGDTATEAATVTQSFTVAKAGQSILFAPLPSRAVTDPAFGLSATATSGLEVTFSSLTPATCTVSGSTVTLVAAGTCTIAANQEGTANLDAAQATQSFAVTADCTMGPARLPAAWVGLPYNQPLTLGGGTSPATWTSTGTLPPGMTFNDGVLAGTPAARGAFEITFTGVNGHGCQTSASYTIAVSAERRVIVGAGAGGAVRAFTLAGATVAATYDAGSGFAGGASVAQGDVDGNGHADVITGAGPGAGPTVTVFDGATGAPRLSFVAFAPTFRGGVEVAAGDITGDGLPEILVAPGCAAGSTPVIRAFDGRAGTPVRDYVVPAAVSSCGLHVAAGDVNGDGVADIVVGSAGLGPTFVLALDGSTGLVLRELYPYSTGYVGGAFVAAGDVTGDGLADIVTGAGAGGTPHVRAFDGVSGEQIAGPLGSFHAYPSDFSGGVRVAAGDLNGDGRAEVITGAGAGGGPHLRVFDGASATEVSGLGLFAFDPPFGSGIFVAGPPAAARMALDIAATRTAGTGVRIAGWALRGLSVDSVGNDAIHAWALPAAGGAPVFVGAAPGRVARPDVAAFFGGEFLNSGFDFTGTLAPGTYDLIVFARNVRTLKFDQSLVIRITVN